MSGQGAALRVLTEERVEQLLALGRLPSAEKVKELNVGEVGIDRFAPGCLHKCQSLFKLVACKNNIEVLPKRLFTVKQENEDEQSRKRPRTQPIKLTFLDLSYNKLSGDQLTKLCKWGLANLITLKLAGNQLKTIPPKVFHHLPHLRALVLNENQLETITFESELPNLNSLILSDNKLKDLSNLGFQFLPGLKKLSASKNSIKEFPSSICDHCKLIAEIRLSKNQLVHVNEENNLGKLEKLAVLDLSSNKIVNAHDLSGLQSCAALLNVSFVNNPFVFEFSSNKQGLNLVNSQLKAYADFLTSNVLVRACRLRTLDGRPWANYGAQLPSGWAKADTNERKKELKGKEAPSLAADNANKNEERKAHPVAKAKESEKEEEEEEDDDDDNDVNDGVDLPAVKKQKLNEETDSIPERGNERSGIIELVHAEPEKKKKKKDKKKKSKGEKSDGSKSASWAYSRSIDTW